MSGSDSRRAGSSSAVPVDRSAPASGERGLLRGRLSAEAMLIATVLLWSGSYTASRYGVTNGFAPLQYTSLRWVAGGLILVAIVFWREGSMRVQRRDLVYLLPAVLVGVLVNQVTFNYSVSFAAASTVALVFGTLPIFAAMLTRALGWARLHLRHWVATIVSFAGVALVALGASGALSGELGGILLALIASATFAGYSVAVGPLMKRHSALKVSAVVALAGAVGLVIVALPQLVTADWSEPNPLAWGALAYLIFMFVTTTIMWFTAIDRVGAPHATLWSNLQPFIAAVIAVIILSETLGWLQIVGGAVIAVSIVIARWRSKGYVDRMPDVGRP